MQKLQMLNILKNCLECPKIRLYGGGNYFALPPSRCFLVWDKGAGFKDRTYAECELAWVSFDKNAKIFKRDPLAKGDYKGKIHPTQKPIQLYNFCLLNFASKGDKILDTHLGSGSSRIAAFNMGFDFYGCELDKEYFDKAEKRFKLETIQQSLFSMPALSIDEEEEGW